MSLWRMVDSNVDHALWEAALPSGAPILVSGALANGPPPDWMVQHHADRFGNNPPRTELGKTGVRFLFPGETEWREYGYTPRSKP